MKASNVTATAKSTKEVPDLEEAIEEEDDAEIVGEPKAEDEEQELDISKDKYIKQPKIKKPSAAKKAAAKGRKTPREGDDAEGSEEERKPKKARTGKSKGATTKAKAKK
jgi:replication factor C subunit 1